MSSKAGYLVPVPTKLPRELKARLVKWAQQNGVSVSAAVRVMVERGLGPAGSGLEHDLASTAWREGVQKGSADIRSALEKALEEVWGVG